MSAPNDFQGEQANEERYEHDPLLPTGLRNGNDGLNNESAWTFASGGMMLDRREYRTLFLKHLLSLLPALTLVVSVGFIARAIPCELPLHKEKGPDAADRCDAALHTMLTLAASTIGAAFWLAGYSLRPAAWFVASYFAAFPDIGYREIDPTATTIVSIAIQNALSVLLRLGSLAIGYALFIAEAVVNPRVADPDVLHDLSAEQRPDLAGAAVLRPFRLVATDPRFSIAMWVSLGWAVAETVTGCFQILQQLSLYSPALDAPPAAPFQADCAASPSVAGLASPKVLPGKAELSPDFAAQRRPLVSPERRPGTSNSAAGRASTTEDPSAQLEHAREELSKSLHREMPTYGSIPPSTAGPASSSGIGPSSGAGILKKGAHDSPQAPQWEYGYEDERGLRLGVDADDEELDEETFDEMSKAQQREALENTLGVPLPEVPVALCCLWRLDGVLFNVGATVSERGRIADSPFRMLTTIFSYSSFSVPR